MAGYIDQIEAGGSGTEIDISDYDINDGWGILIIFTDINVESTIKNVYINNRKSSYYNLYEYNMNLYDNYIIALVLKNTDPETLTIRITTEYDGSESDWYLRNINKPTNKVAVCERQF